MCLLQILLSVWLLWSPITHLRFPSQPGMHGDLVEPLYESFVSRISILNFHLVLHLPQIATSNQLSYGSPHLFSTKVITLNENFTRWMFALYYIARQFPLKASPLEFTVSSALIKSPHPQSCGADLSKMTATPVVLTWSL